MEFRAHLFHASNEVYIGNMVQGRSQKISYSSKKCRKIPREDWIVVENTHEPIIDRESFEKVASLLPAASLPVPARMSICSKELLSVTNAGIP